MQNVMPQTIRSGKLLGLALAVLMVSAASSFAHCDTMDGPVVKAAQSALKTKNVNFVLIWVSKKDETEVKQTFRLALRVRVLNREARQLADKYFFETVVRLHRAVEGQPYTGLKPAGTNVDPVIRAADQALNNGSPETLVKFFPENIRAEVEDRFRNTVSRKKFQPNDVEAGRKYVEAYVSLLEYLEHHFLKEPQSKSISFKMGPRWGPITEGRPTHFPRKLNQTFACNGLDSVAWNLRLDQKGSKLLK